MNRSQVGTSIQDRFSLVQERIAHAAQQAGRNRGEVRLVVVTKAQPVEVIRAAIEAGAAYLGENYADEAAPKIETITSELVSSEADVEWHMIGHIQSRKAALVCQYFRYVHSLDSLKLARKLNKGMGEVENPPAGQRLPVLLECNVSGEGNKFGFPAWEEHQWEGILPHFEEIISLPRLDVLGLMTVPPFSDEAEASRSYFQRLRRLQAFLARQFPKTSWRELSMGMSADYEVAIEEGATWVRIGQAILGPRG